MKKDSNKGKNHNSKPDSIWDILKSADSNNNILTNLSSNNENYEEKICKSFNIKTSDFECEKTASLIHSIPEGKRLIYSNISNYIYNLDDEHRGIFISNVDALQEFSESESTSLDEQDKRFILKIYDHCHLAVYQIEMSSKNSASVKTAITEEIENVKSGIRNELKDIEKEYITILGIFSSVVLAFMGGISFSASVLEGIDAVSKYRLVLVILLLGLILFNTISLLLCFIWKITQNKSNKIPEEDIKKRKLSNVAKGIIVINVVIFVIILVILFVWSIQTGFWSSFLQNFKEIFCHSNIEQAKNIIQPATAIA